MKHNICRSKSDVYIKGLLTCQSDLNRFFVWQSWEAKVQEQNVPEFCKKVWTLMIDKEE